jgi:uncharacterized protein (TIGR02599 family)
MPFRLSKSGPPLPRTDWASFLYPGSRTGKNAFSLLEVLVVCTLLVVLFAICYSLINISTSAWVMHRTRLSAFERARIGFELVTNRLAQATLNTYWDYDNPVKPTHYVRKSELHFVMGKAEELLPDVSGLVTQSVFFLSPLGFNTDPVNQPLRKTLSGCGFFIRFSEEPFLPATMLERNAQPRYRYRLFQFLQSGEDVDIYGYTPSGVSRDLSKEREWFTDHVTGASYPVADNIIGLILRANYTSTSSSGSTNHGDYEYDTRNFSQAITYNQLPPSVSVTMIMIDEDSAIRLAAQYGASAPPIIPPPDDQHDLQKWENLLNNFTPKINYRIFTADVPIRGAKWSSD